MLVLAADHVLPMKTRSVPPCVMPCHMPKRQAGDLRHCAGSTRNRLWLYCRGEVSAGEQDTVAFEVAQFSKNRIWKPPRPMWQAANITGQRYVPVPRRTLSRRTEKISPDILDACEKAMSAVDPDLDFFVWMKKRFSPARKSRWITRSGTYGRCCCGADGCGLERCWSWSSLWEISAHTAEGNVCHGM